MLKKLMYVTVSLAMLISLVLTGDELKTVSAASASVVAIEDAVIRGGTNANTVQTGQPLEVKDVNDTTNEYDRKIFLKFDLFDIKGAITSGTLKVYVNAVTGSMPLKLYSLTDDRWGEKRITWGNAPSGTLTHISTQTVSTTGWRNFDVSSALTSAVASGNKVISFVLLDDTGADKSIKINSREDGSNQPHIGLNYNDPTGWWKPGMYNKDGSAHTIHTPNPQTKATINVTSYGVDLADNGNDDTPGILAALNASTAGNAIYFPTGVYNLESGSPGRPNEILWKSGVNLRGNTTDPSQVVFKSHEASNGKHVFFKLEGVNNVVMQGFTFTSDFTGPYQTTDSMAGGPWEDAPYSGIDIDHLPNTATPDAHDGSPSYNITVDKVVIEKYKAMGVRINRSRDVVVKNSLFRNATNVGGGGHGYGVSILGGIHGIDRTDQTNDTRHNYVHNNTFQGPQMRHGVLMQYYAHNNLAENNLLDQNFLEALDLHGEDEYLNEFYNNTITNCQSDKSGAIGVGHTGSTHDKAGPGNLVRGNTISGCMVGIRVIKGTEDTIIQDNIIHNSSTNYTKGIWLNNAIRTKIIDNKIYNLTGTGSWGVFMTQDTADSTTPIDTRFINNKISGAGYSGNTNGVKVEHGSIVVDSDNDISGNSGAQYQNFQHS